MKTTSGRPGDVACWTCQRPLTFNQAWKRKRANGRGLEYYCAEHVIITDGGHNWRPRTKSDPEDLPPMGTPAPAVPDTEPMRPLQELLAGGVAWDDAEPPVMGALKHQSDHPTTTTGFQEVLLMEERAPAEDDEFDPLNDVGF